MRRSRRAAAYGPWTAVSDAQSPERRAVGAKGNTKTDRSPFSHRGIPLQFRGSGFPFMFVLVSRAQRLQDASVLVCFKRRELRAG